MKFASMNLSKIHVLRIDPGEDVLEAMEHFLKEAGVQQAVVLGGYGTLATYHIHWVTHNRIPTNNAFGRGEGGIEILSMNGLVVEGKPHVHVTLSTQVGAFGGHLEPGCITHVRCKVFFAQVEGTTIRYESVPVAVEGIGEGTISRLAFDA
jgi:predicted DNA-binding protein with PD1-like motif